MGQVGLEPTRGDTPEDFKSSASASSATAPSQMYCIEPCIYVKEYGYIVSFATLYVNQIHVWES